MDAIKSVEALDQLWEESTKNPIVILKHSNSCPISGNAYDEMTKIFSPISLVIVQERRDISNAIEKKSGIEHESPQVLILKDKKVVWNASHRQVTAENVEAALGKLK